MSPKLSPHPPPPRAPWLKMMAWIRQHTQWVGELVCGTWMVLSAWLLTSLWLAYRPQFPHRQSEGLLLMCSLKTFKPSVLLNLNLQMTWKIDKKTHQHSHWLPAERDGGLGRNPKERSGVQKCFRSSLSWWWPGIIHSSKFIKLFLETVHVSFYRYHWEFESTYVKNSKLVFSSSSIIGVSGHSSSRPKVAGKGILV